MQNLISIKKILIFLASAGIVCFSSCSKVQKTYYPNGKIESEVTWRKGQMQGKAVWYYEHGQKRMEAHYDHGRLQGECVR